MRVLLVHSDSRHFEPERFGAAWVRGGGQPGELVAVSPSTAKAVLEAVGPVAGVLLTGGPDVEPRRYGREPEPGVELHVVPERDALDLGLLRKAEERSWPVLAVCYGCQMLAVAAGGTLIQDLPAAGKRGHSVTEPKDFLAHRVRLERPRWLPSRPVELAVNSRHHQAIDDPGALRVVARADDGVVEAVEAEVDRFVLGVQWHPENIAAPEHDAVFRAFRAACIERSGR